jgi:hypothetical protein
MESFDISFEELFSNYELKYEENLVLAIFFISVPQVRKMLIVQ